MPKRNNKIVELIQIMGVLVLIVGAAVYLLTWVLKDETASQQGQGTVSNTQNEKPQQMACQFSSGEIERVKAAAVGGVSAFIPMDRPYSLDQFAFADLSGRQMSISDWAGKAALVNLWATWCAPCREEMPSLDRLQAKLGGEQFEVVAISVDRSEPSKPKGFFEEISIEAMRFFHDREASTLDQLKRDGLALGLPATLLVDATGCALGRVNGPVEWDSPDALKLIKAAMQPVNQ